MERLPMISRCALEETELDQQLERYRRIGKGARVVAHHRQTLVIEVDPSVKPELILEAIAVERQCCPYFALNWQASRRRLAVSVSTAEQQPALDAIAVALGIATKAKS
jgi:hypothetical protein